MMANRFALGGVRLKQVAAGMWSEVRANDVFGRAAQLAYYFFLALFPFLIFVISTLSVFGVADRGHALLFQFLAHVIPPAGFEVIDNTFSAIIHSSGPLKMSAGICFSIWSASMGMSAVMDTLNAAYKVTETRSVLKQYAVATGLTVGLAALLIASLGIIVFGDEIVSALLHTGIMAEAWRVAQWPLELIFVLFAFAITYYFAPNLTNRPWHWITPGSVFGVILWTAGSLGLRIYLHFASYSGTYGPLGAVIILLLWFYLSGIAVLSGAVLNAVLERLATSNHVPRKTVRGDLYRPMMDPRGQPT